MFTGIVEAMGKVVSVAGGERGRTVVIGAPFAGELHPGQSVAVDGACLTATEFDADCFTVEIGSSTLERTTAAEWSPGRRVNLERAARIGDRLDGHLVQGHVDGTGTLAAHRQTENTRLLDFTLPPEIFSITILHGSIAINGSSLTVNELSAPARIQVAIIPHTWEHTNLARLDPGERVNVEADLVGKYIRRILETHAP